ncbi:MAG: HAD-IA family hydrolase [Bdellovibrionales bacterium]|nr:HAD-IA family hydrolase [Bdellovibrionales bacterium]
MDRARSLRLPVAIVSDMLTAIQIKKICALKIEPLISFLITSEEVGVEKPNPRIFEVALAKLGLTAGQVIMIGDHQDKDILGSQKLGLLLIG